MAHIADFMVNTDPPNSVGLNNYIAREVSPVPFQEAATEISNTEEKEKEKHVWRMHQPSGSRKLHLFPSREKLSIGSTGRRSPDSVTQAAKEAALDGVGEKERSILGGALKLKSKDQKTKEQTLVRRRKVSVPDLGPMTTVQEVAMDSPTIPGRPPIHERSTSAPGNSWRQHMFGETMISGITGPILDESLEHGIFESPSMPALSCQSRTASASPSRRPLSPKCLAPLVIPSSSAPKPQRLAQRLRQRSESTPPDVPPKSARMKELSPHGRFSPYTPGSAAYTPGSASTTSLSISSALASSVGTTPTMTPEGQRSPKQWVSPIPSHTGPSPMTSHTRGQSESQPRIPTNLGHRRGDSETSIMDRGRPKKRADGTTVKRTASKRNQSKGSLAEEQKAFETLPQGTRATNATSVMPVSEIDALRKQAIGQASQFDVLTVKDVENLSRELRSLDERCDYLRKTHRSLRSGRRNLHDRICSFLRSPRVATFSNESILKQEEALSELDASIDDWVDKLDHAENRRTRIRQKLLEHVAAALILQPTSINTPPRSPTKVSQSHSTPPRSPTKAQSPHRLAEEVKVTSPESLASHRKTRIMSVESIKIYADSDVYALLADVEDEIKRMGERTLAEENSIINDPTLRKEEKMEPETTVEAILEAEVTLSAAVFRGLPSTVFEGLPSTVYKRAKAT